MQGLKKYSGLLSLVFPLFFYAQAPGEQLIKWDAARKLSWNDYSGTPDPASDAAASTSTYLGIEYNIVGSSLTYKISCNFSKNKSWVRFKNDYILSHEQGHFDITEIFARKLNKEMSSYQFNRSTYRKDLDKIYRDITDEKDQLQSQYDRETDFSRNREKQAEWLKKIDKMLEDLKEFSNYNQTN